MLWNTHHLRCLCLSRNVYDIFSTGSREHRFPTVGHTQHYIQGHTALQFMGAVAHTHSSHALAGSHTVDSRPSAEVINDFLWLPSNSPSIVNPLFPIEATPPVLSLSSLLVKTAGWTLLEEQEVVAGRRRVMFTIHWGSTKFRRHCAQDTLLSHMCVWHV